MSEFPADWKISDPVLIANGIGGKVWRVQSAEGPAIAKQVSTLALRELSYALDYLYWRNGDGTARLLNHRDDWLLLQDAGDRHLLDHLDVIGDDAATEIAAHAIARLHAPSVRPLPRGLMPLRSHFGSLFKLAANVAADPIFLQAAERADRLLSPQAQQPLHGDFHHENLIDGPRGWLAIDPKGLIGEAAYDAANLFYNPLESALRTDPNRLMRMASTLACVLGHTPDRLLEFAFAHACLSASWHREDGSDHEAERSLDVARAIDHALAQFRS